MISMPYGFMIIKFNSVIKQFNIFRIFLGRAYFVTTMKNLLPNIY